MRRLSASIVLITCAIFLALASKPAERPWRYVDARELRIINKGFADTQGPYTRLPLALKDSVRPELWRLGLNSAGIAVRFATNSSRIGVRYKLMFDNHMPHMADTGIKGTDIYVFEGDSAWRHANTNRPIVNNTDDKICESVYLNNLDTTRLTEYMLYFPLYDGVERLEVKIDSTAAIGHGDKDLISPTGRIVAYGTSIMQGGCASRTGMASTNIISRALNREVINLGHSGQGKMDACMARAMATIPDVAAFIIDPVPNCTEMMCDTLTYGFIDIIRKARPEVPIVMVEGPIYPYARYDSYFGRYLPAKNAAFRRNYERLKADGADGLHYVDAINLDGPEDDGTVDGIHLTDLGFKHYSAKLIPILKRILNE